MSKQLFKRMRWGLVLTLVLVLLAAAPASRPHPAAAQMPMGANGMVCTHGPTFTLTTQTGYVGTPDDNIVYMWGFSAQGMPFQHPSPVLCVTQGDTVTITLQNTLPYDVSITFPGQDDVLANGAPVQPQFSGTTLTSLTNVAPANGGSMTYSFVANHPGTFLYQSGTNPGIQVRVGLFGVLVVHPSINDEMSGLMYANSRLDSQYNPAAEYLVLFSEIDPSLSQAVEQATLAGGGAINFNLKNYIPRYWLINGRGFPDTIAPNYASWLPSQPYGALARINLQDATNPLPYLERFANVGTEIIPMHPHAKNALLVNQDGRPVEGPLGQDLAWENFSVPVGPGQTYDGLFKYKDAEGYSPTNPLPVTVPGVQNLVYGAMYSGSPYLGFQGPFPVGVTSMNECGEFYIISHNHALYQLTSFGAPMTGPITFLRVDPPMPNTCMP